MRTPVTTGLIAATLIGTLSLTACGGATVEDTGATATSVAPLDRAPRSTEASSEQSSEKEAEDADESAAASSSREPGPDRPAAPQPQDQGAREVDEVPAQEAARSPQDVDYLGALTDQDIDVAGVEDQLIGTATVVCNPEGTGIDQATVPAVAGQLVEQGRTDKSAEELTQLIVDNARQAYC